MMNSKHNCQELIKAFREGRLIPNRAGAHWDKRELGQLKDLYMAGVGISQIALQLRRTERAVMKQLFKTELLRERRGPQRAGQYCCSPYCASKKICKYCPLQKED